MLRGNFLKRRYLDLRLGGVTVNPIIQASNFVMISYILFQDSISFWLYAPLFFSGVVSIFVVTGLFFRRIQLSTDEDLKYEKQKELNRTLLEIMRTQKKIMGVMNITPDDSFGERYDYIKKISKD